MGRMRRHHTAEPAAINERAAGAEGVARGVAAAALKLPSGPNRHTMAS